MAPKLSLSVNEILRALAGLKANDESPDGFFTSAEIARAMQCSPSSVRNKLNDLKAAGVPLDVRRVVREAIDGTMRPSPVYRVGKRKP